MPRLTKLTPETHAKIIRFIYPGGCYLESACAAAGIGTQTMRDWLKRAASKPRSIYGKFAADVEEALGMDEARTVMTHERLSASSVEGKATCGKCGEKVTISVPVPGNVQLHALQWKLERKFPKRYGNRIKVTQELESEIDAVFAKLQRHLTTEEYDRVIEVLDAPDS